MSTINLTKRRKVHTTIHRYVSREELMPSVRDGPSMKQAGIDASSIKQKQLTQVQWITLAFASIKTKKIRICQL